MTNEIGKALFSKAGELGVPVGFMCMKVLQLLVFNSLIGNYIKAQVTTCYKLCNSMIFLEFFVPLLINDVNG